MLVFSTAASVASTCRLVSSPDLDLGTAVNGCRHVLQVRSFIFFIFIFLKRKVQSCFKRRKKRDSTFLADARVRIWTQSHAKVPSSVQFSCNWPRAILVHTCVFVHGPYLFQTRPFICPCACLTTSALHSSSKGPLSFKLVSFFFSKSTCRLLLLGSGYIHFFLFKKRTGRPVIRQKRLV